MLRAPRLPHKGRAGQRLRSMAVYSPDAPLHALASSSRKQLPCRRQAAAFRKGRRRRVDCRLLQARTPNSDDVKEAEEALAALVEARSRQREKTLPPAEAEAPEEPRPLGRWRQLQAGMEHKCLGKLKEDLGESLILKPVYPAPDVQRQFLGACKRETHNLLATYHGTKSKNIDSIKHRGLLVPGNGGIKVANGSAHGVGIYTAQLGHASLSRGFCDSDTMFVCAVCDTSKPVAETKAEDLPKPWKPSMTYVQTVFPKPGQHPSLQFRNHRLTHKSEEVIHVGDAVVVFREEFVVPVFTAKIRAENEPEWYSKPQEEEMWHVGPQQVGRRRLAMPDSDDGLIKFGGYFQERSGSTLWLPRLPKRDATTHERRVARRLNRRTQRRDRAEERLAKCLAHQSVLPS